MLKFYSIETMLSSKLEKILISEKQLLDNSKEEISVKLISHLKLLLTSYSIATLLLTRSVVVIATAAESALHSHNLIEVCVKFDIQPHRRPIMVSFEDVQLNSCTTKH